MLPSPKETPCFPNSPSARNPRQRAEHIKYSRYYGAVTFLVFMLSKYIVLQSLDAQNYDHVIWMVRSSSSPKDG